MENAPSHPMPGRGVGPAVPPRLPPVSRPVTALGPPARSSAMTGGSRLRLLRSTDHRHPFRAGARGGWSWGARHRAPTVPGSLCGATVPTTAFPSLPVTGMLHRPIRARRKGWASA